MPALGSPCAAGLHGKRDADHTRRRLGWWKDELGEHALANVTPALLAQTRNKLAQGMTYRGGQRSPATVVRYLAALGAAYTYGEKELQWVEENPVRKVSKPKQSSGRVRYLSDDERARLLEACMESRAEFLRPVVVLALATGMRRGEIMNLYWREPKSPPAGAWGVAMLDQARIVLHDTKNRDTRAVPLVGPALDAVREMAKVRRLDTDLLFPGRGDPQSPADLRTAWDAAVERAGIENFRFHDLRHSAASYLAMSGASLAEIAETLGHRTLAMVKRYSHLSEQHTAGVLERMSRKFLEG